MSPQALSLALNIIFGVLLAAGSILFVFYIHSLKVVSRAVAAAKHGMAQASLDAARAGMLDAMDEEQGTLAKVLAAPRRHFTYARLSDIFPRLTCESWMLILVFGTCLLYFAGYGATGSSFTGLACGAVYFCLLYVAELLLMRRNWKSVDGALVPFLNQLANFSVVGSNDVAAVLHQVARYVPYPLSAVLDECYFEAQTSGSQQLAVRAMAEKVEHAKFKEIIRNLDGCMSYTSDYSVVVDSLRRNLLDEKRGAQDRKSLAANAVSEMGIVSVMVVTLLGLSSNLFEQNLFALLFTDRFGNVCLAVAAVSYALFAWNVARAER